MQDVRNKLGAATRAFEAGDLESARRLGEEAARHFEEALSRAPEDAEILDNLGQAYLASGRIDAASQVLKKALAVDPGSPAIRNSLGRAAMADGRPDEALSLFREAAQLLPQGPVALYELGISFLRFSLHEEALPLFAEAARKGMRNAELFNLIGSCCAALDSRRQAEQAYRMALSMDARNIRAYVNLGLFLEHENRLDDLSKLMGEASRNAVGGPDIGFLQALLLQREGKLEEALSTARAAVPEVLDPIIYQEFVGKLADRLGKFDIAFESFLQMNNAMAMMPEARRHDGSEYPAAIRRNTATLSQQWYGSWTKPLPPDDRPAPVFLGGFLRSGTTLLDTVLMGHRGLQVREEEAMIPRLEQAAGAFDQLGALEEPDLRELRDLYYDVLSQNGDVPAHARPVDKYPMMPLRAAQIHRIFPGAKFVFLQRHPCDVVLSCFMQNFRINSAMASFLTLENSARLYDATMDHWHRAQEVFPLDIHTIRYEDLVTDLEAHLRPLIAFLDLEWDAALLDHRRSALERGYISTPSYSQVTEQLYTRSSGRWEAYRKHIEPVLPMLAPWADRFGYDIG